MGIKKSPRMSSAHTEGLGGGSPKSASASANSTKKMFKCEGYKDCNMAFTRAEHLARHIRKHTGEKPFQCYICLKYFSRVDNLKQHRDSVHAKVNYPPSYFHEPGMAHQQPQQQGHPGQPMYAPLQERNTAPHPQARLAMQYEMQHRAPMYATAPTNSQGISSTTAYLQQHPAGPPRLPASPRARAAFPSVAPQQGAATFNIPSQQQQQQQQQGVPVPMGMTQLHSIAAANGHSPRYNGDNVLLPTMLQNYERSAGAPLSPVAKQWIPNQAQPTTIAAYPVIQTTAPPQPQGQGAPVAPGPNKYYHTAHSFGNTPAVPYGQQPQHTPYGTTTILPVHSRSPHGLSPASVASSADSVLSEAGLRPAAVAAPALAPVGESATRASKKRAAGQSRASSNTAGHQAKRLEPPAVPMMHAAQGPGGQDRLSVNYIIL